MTLRHNGRVRYSELENRVLNAIPLNGEKIDTLALVERVYAADERPRYARQTVLSTIDHLIAKTNDNREAWQILKSAARGCLPVSFWREDRAAPEPLEEAAPEPVEETVEVAPSEPETIETVVAQEVPAPMETVPARPPCTPIQMFVESPVRAPGELRMMAKTVIRLERRLRKQVAEATRTNDLITELCAVLKAEMAAP